ncbi:tripartite tricarboxylate transporter TctB family protein [Aidingimonas halophila]|uniref:Putative tricarboxylic transport membrane protein n=1 Tax=Aidingimonas halophila TaxID=574349 RepID=A0A1H2V4L7_9GAMM|nr:tripartite tricarboxylate transporter TctB family protein [Aidingimonas halophila]GHC23719.1 membrane protein [Aidingimonas halophila]SDW63170.1 putative tricarboxylic transport membrane protein [Aidingimonas halophila]
MKLAADRLLGIVLTGLAAFIAVQALRLNVPISYDPVGPKAFPLGLAILLAMLSLVLVFKPGEDGQWPHRALTLKILLVLGVMLIYALLFTRLGFIITTLMTVAMLARIFDASWNRALITGVVMSVGSFFLFTDALGISLPGGYWLETWF